MAANANATIYGKVIKDPEKKTFSTGMKGLAFCVAVKTTVKGDDGYYKSNFYNVTVFGKQAEFLANSLQKGSNVVVSGDLEIREYAKKDGTIGYSINMTANNVILAGGGAAGGKEPAKGNPDAKVAQKFTSIANEEMPW